ncbi:MAG: UDP-N-acetylmuramoyl-tripeptide--D-alanyl-D-alanine ligase [Lachnospiraceae bacterium]|nr:UDP-N-acetylmuramoyl-tripeptide--D-alanyl-D-alanine ligase [Lachnospiraceae bacterium]
MEKMTIKEIVEAVDGVLLCGDESLCVTSVSTNSNEIEKDALFVPIIGERTDAHNYIQGAFANGAIATFTSRHTKDSDDMENGVYIQVEDTLRAMQKLATAYREKFEVPVIGITGSVGKTTTKEMISAALATKYNVLKTKGNMNSQVGLALMMFEINQDTEVAVIEMGMSEWHEMERLVQIAKPKYAVMTNIGVSHIGQLGSKENIRKEKLNIINCMDENSILYLNGDDRLLLDVAEGKLKEEHTTPLTKEALTKVSFHIFSTNECDREERVFFAKDIKARENGMEFTYVNGEEEADVKLSVLGMHNVGNALVAMAIAKQFGIAPQDAAKGLLAYAPIAMRGQIFEKDGIRIIDDTYNASPDSMKSGIGVLLMMEGTGRRFAVLADVLELGEDSYRCHYEVGGFIANEKNGENYVNELLCIGTEAKAIADGLLHAGTDLSEKIIVHKFEYNEQAIAYLKEHLQKGDIVMVKGSRGMHTEEIVESLNAV